MNCRVIFIACQGKILPPLISYIMWLSEALLKMFKTHYLKKYGFLIMWLFSGLTINCILCEQPIMDYVNSLKIFNPFHAASLFLYPLKISEILPKSNISYLSPRIGVKSKKCQFFGGFPMFSEGLERNQQHEMGLIVLPYF